MKLNMLVVTTLVAGLFISCEKEMDYSSDNEFESLDQYETLKALEQSEALKSKKANSGFMHGIEIDIDGEMYYFAGAPDGMDGAVDVPGHYWVQSGKDQIVGKHYNTGPFGMSKWWSSDAKDGALLYMVHGIIDTWSLEKAAMYKEMGYVHRHEFISVAGGEFHPSKVVWLKHISRTSFTLDGGPGAPNPPYEHYVTPGVDLMFPNNGFMAYPED